MKPSPKKRIEEIDWKQVRQRLARAAERQEAAALSPERARQVLEERAVTLARVPVEATADGAGIEVIVFALADERYAIETQYVCEVIRLADLTPLPGAPEFLAGVTSLRGQIVAVVELRKFFGVAPRGLTDLARLVVLGSDQPEFGVLADAVHEVVTLRKGQLLEPAGAVAGVGREYLRGITADALIVLDGAALLQDPRLFVDQGEDPNA